MLNAVLRVSSVILIIGNRLYWELAARQAQLYKPAKKVKVTLWMLITRLIHPIFEVLIPLQLLGLEIIPINSYQIAVQLIGFILLLLGIGIGVMARIEIGHNWSADRTYQVKHQQVLVTSGIYKVVRHPIYLGRIIAFTGAELVAQSYMFVLVFIIYTLFSVIQAKKEESLLSKTFGAEYTAYMQTNKRLFPGVY